MASRGSGSQQKGKNHEREVAKIIAAALGVDVKRTASPERWKINKGDVNIPQWQESIGHDFVWECKNREAGSLYAWYHKIEDDIGLTPKLPILIATKNQEDNYAFMKLSHFLRILRELDEYRKESKQKSPQGN